MTNRSIMLHQPPRLNSPQSTVRDPEPVLVLSSSQDSFLKALTVTLATHPPPSPRACQLLLTSRVNISLAYSSHPTTRLPFHVTMRYIFYTSMLHWSVKWWNCLSSRQWSARNHGGNAQHTLAGLSPCNELSCVRCSIFDKTSSSRVWMN